MKNSFCAKKTTNREMKSKKNLFFHGLFLLFYGFVKYLSFPFSNYLRFLVLRVFLQEIKSTHVMDGVTIWFPWRVRIGRFSSLNQGVIIDGYGGVSIGEGVRVAAYCVLNTADHDFSEIDVPIRMQGFIAAPITIEDDVWLGTGVNVNKGVLIGRGSVIGSGSVVTKDIPPYSVAVGVPCRVIGSRGKKGVEEN